MLSEPPFDKVSLLDRYYPMPFQAAGVFAVFRDDISAAVGYMDQSVWSAAFAVVGGVNDVSGLHSLFNIAPSSLF